MKCLKCQGFLYLEEFSDYFLTFYAWKCVNCGALTDQTVLENRMKRLPAADGLTAAQH